MQIFIMYYIRPIHQPISTHLSIWPAISIDMYPVYVHITLFITDSEILKGDTVLIMAISMRRL